METKMTIREAIENVRISLGSIGLSTELIEQVGLQGVQTIMNQIMIPLARNVNMLKNVIEAMDRAEAEKASREAQKQQEENAEPQETESAGTEQPVPDGGETT